MAKLVAVFNIKGGVGKTTSAVNLAYLAAKSGYKTLIWDMDHQGAAGYFLDVDDQLKGGLKSVVKDMDNAPAKRKLFSKALQTDFEDLDILPSDMSLRMLDIRASEANQTKKFIEKLLLPMQQEYDYIFVDCPPGLSLANESLLYAADLVLVPTIPTVLSVRMLEQLRDYIFTHIKDKTRRPKIRAFFNMMDTRKSMHKEIFDQLCVKRKTLVLPIAVPNASVAERMGTERTPIAEFAPNSPAAKEYDKLWRIVDKMRL